MAVKRPAKLNVNEQLIDIHSGREVEILHAFPNGNLVVTTFHPANRAITVDRYGRYIDANGHTYTARVKNEVREKVEFVTLYPTGQWYSKECCPVSTSSYDLDDLIQLKITRRNGKIVKKEFC